MTGGTIIIDGDAGNEIGHTMRRGMIAIGGTAGDMLAFNIIAGTVLVFGPCGIRPGAGMRRGTLALFGPRPSLLPTFRYGTTFQPLALRMILLGLQRRGLSLDPALFTNLLTGPLDLYHGDLVALGKGEIFVRGVA
jgi:formylmethanofuran dehydrogenase subunit C